MTIIAPREFSRVRFNSDHRVLPGLIGTISAAETTWINANPMDTIASPRPLQSRRSILVVDDDPSVLTTLDYMLTGQGYRVLLASSGPEGILLAAENSPDGALVDINMSPMDGFRTCAGLKAQAKVAGCDLTIWMMTTAYSKIFEDVALKTGAIELLRKPFDYADLFAKLETKFPRQIDLLNRASQSRPRDTGNAGYSNSA